MSFKYSQLNQVLLESNTNYHKAISDLHKGLDSEARRSLSNLLSRSHLVPWGQIPTANILARDVEKGLNRDLMLASNPLLECFLGYRGADNARSRIARASDVYGTLMLNISNALTRFIDTVIETPSLGLEVQRSGDFTHSFSVANQHHYSRETLDSRVEYAVRFNEEEALRIRQSPRGVLIFYDGYDLNRQTKSQIYVNRPSGEAPYVSVETADGGTWNGALVQRWLNRSS